MGLSGETNRASPQTDTHMAKMNENADEGANERKALKHV
jgi:hypothetical protein